MGFIAKRIPGFSLYSATDEGHLRTFNWKNTGRPAQMKPAKDANGYLRTVLIRDDGKYCTVKVHRIIALTWIPNPENKPEVNHKDGNKENNAPPNLEWVTHIENVNHCHLNGLQKPQPGSLNGFSKLTESEVLEIRAKYKPHVYTRKMLGAEYGVDHTTIKDVVNRRRWTHI